MPKKRLDAVLKDILKQLSSKQSEKKKKDSRPANKDFFKAKKDRLEKGVIYV